MNNPEEKKVAWLASIAHFLTHAYMTLLPAVLVVLTGIEGLTFVEIGVIGTAGYMLYGVGSIPAGILTDKYGAKRMLTAGVIGMAVTSILVGISPVGWFFAVSYALFGLTASIYHPSGLPLIAKNIEKKGKALGFHGIMGNLGITAGPLFAAVMIMVFNTWRAAYIVLGIIGLGFAFYMQKVQVENEADFSFSDIFAWYRNRKAAKAEAAAQVNAETAPGQSGDLFSEANTVPDKTVIIPVSLIMIYIGCMLFGFIYRGAITYFPTLYQQEIDFISSQLPPEPTVLAGLLTSVVLSFGMVGLWLAGYISDRIKRPEAAQIIVFATIVPLLYIISNSSEVPVLIYSAVFSLVFFGWQPLQNTLIANYTSKRSHGIGYGINFFLIMGVGSIATAAGGYLTDEHGAYAVYSMLALVAVVGIIAAIGVLKFNKYSIKFNYSLLKENQEE
jgi:MFS family permease